VGRWCGYLSGARCRLAYGPADVTAIHCLFASVKSRLVLPLWYWLTRVVPGKGPLNRCVCACVCPRPSTTIHSIIFFSIIFLVQFTCLTVLFHNLSPGPLWSSSWSGTLCFILQRLVVMLSSRLHSRSPMDSSTAAAVRCYPLPKHFFTQSSSFCNTCTLSSAGQSLKTECFQCIQYC